MSITYEIPVKTVSEANLRDHWAVRRRRTETQRTAGFVFTRSVVLPDCLVMADLSRIISSHTLVITLTRLGPRKMDSDNLARSMKAVRDGIADALGLDDGDDRIDWRYRQEPGKKQYGVRVEIEEGT